MAPSPRHRRAPHLLGALSLCFVLALWGCEERTAARSSADNETALKADLKADLEIVKSPERPERPERIVSLAPNLTEVLFALGAGERVVGVTRFCDYPPEAVAALPKVGGFVDPDLEAILAARPDLVVGMKAGEASIADRLQEANLRYVAFQADDIASTRALIEELGALIGAEQQAEALIVRFDSELKPRPLPDGLSAPEVLFVLGHDPLIAAGHGTFAHQLIERAGGRNALAASRGAYPVLDMERVIALDPDLILDAVMAPEDEERDGSTSTFWSAYGSLAAVERGQIQVVDDPALLRPGPRLGGALKRLAPLVHGAARGEAR